MAKDCETISVPLFVADNEPAGYARLPMLCGFYFFFSHLLGEPMKHIATQDSPGLLICNADEHATRDIYIFCHFYYI